MPLARRLGKSPPPRPPASPPLLPPSMHERRKHDPHTIRLAAGSARSFGSPSPPRSRRGRHQASDGATELQSPPPKSPHYIKQIAHTNKHTRGLNAYMQAHQFWFCLQSTDSKQNASTAIKQSSKSSAFCHACACYPSLGKTAAPDLTTRTSCL